MINLIPPSAQKQVKREYWVRVISVWTMLIASACLIVAILNVPAYVLVRSQLSSYLQEYNQATVKSESVKDSEEAITRSNELATLLLDKKADAQFSKVMGQLEALTGEGIAISEFKLTRKDGAIDSIAISGTANSRQELSAFHQAIEAEALFESATLPLSNLAKDRDIPFTITIVPHNNTKK